MAYGKGTTNSKLHKAVPIGMGIPTKGKLAVLALLRDKYLETANRMSEAVTSPEPLCGLTDSGSMDSILIAIQKSAGSFNQAYAEKCRLAVHSSITENEKRYYRSLYGRLAHCSEKIDPPDAASNRRYYYVPETAQDTITASELEALEQITKSGNVAVFELFKQVIVNGDPGDLTDNQAQVLFEIHKQSLAKYGKPVFGIDKEFICQIHLDYRVVRGKDTGPRLDGEARILLDSSNKCYRSFLELSNPVPRAEPIRIPLTLSRNLLKYLERGKAYRQDDGAFIQSLILEVGPKTVNVRAVIVKEPPPMRGLNQCKAFVGRDFGYANTVTVTVVERDRKVDYNELQSILSFSKAQAEKYLKTHCHPLDNVIEKMRFSGKRFLGLIEKHSRKIDDLKSRIDLEYNHIGRLKGILAGHMGLSEGEVIQETAMFDDVLVSLLRKKFFGLLAHVNRLKTLRRKLYKKVADAKKHWFGFLSRVEAALARHYKGAVIREDLTVVAEEKDKPAYKGRTFNKMINNGSKGQYIRRASGKFIWDGIPEVALPSFYTSCTCNKHALVDKNMRSGEKFACPKCVEHRHADENASHTIANYLLLRPMFQ
jgi:transposase